MNNANTNSGSNQIIDEQQIQLLYMSFYMAWLKIQGESVPPEFLKFDDPLV